MFGMVSLFIPSAWLTLGQFYRSMQMHFCRDFSA